MQLLNGNETLTMDATGVVTIDGVATALMTES